MRSPYLRGCGWQRGNGFVAAQRPKHLWLTDCATKAEALARPEHLHPVPWLAANQQNLGSIPYSGRSGDIAKPVLCAICTGHPVSAKPPVGAEVCKFTGASSVSDGKVVQYVRLKLQIV